MRMFGLIMKRIESDEGTTFKTSTPPYCFYIVVSPLTPSSSFSYDHERIIQIILNSVAQPSDSSGK